VREERRRTARVLVNRGYSTRSRISPECGKERRRTARVLVNRGYSSCICIPFFLLTEVSKIVLLLGLEKWRYLVVEDVLRFNV
jgi:hypothetical protein